MSISGERSFRKERPKQARVGLASLLGIGVFAKLRNPQSVHAPEALDEMIALIPSETFAQIQPLGGAAKKRPREFLVDRQNESEFVKADNDALKGIARAAVGLSKRSHDTRTLLNKVK
jgi:hypothetical protein